MERKLPARAVYTEGRVASSWRAHFTLVLFDLHGFEESSSGIKEVQPSEQLRVSGGAAVAWKQVSIGCAPMPLPCSGSFQQGRPSALQRCSA